MKKILCGWILKPLCVFLILSISLFLVCLIPSKYIEDNANEALKTFEKEGYFPEIKYANKYILDNFTDALMINTAYSVDSNKPLESTILMKRYYKTSLDSEKTILHLSESLSGARHSFFEYSRYWHGYMIFLRPALVFFEYSVIRIILISVIVIITLILLFFTYKKFNIYMAITLLLTFVVANFWVIGLSLQYSFVFIISIISALYILIKNKIRNIESSFFVIGMLTSFFDLLTAPLLTLGFPLIFYILKLKEENITLKKFLGIILSWFIGYGLMWSLKWIIAELFYNYGTIELAFSQIFNWTGINSYMNFSVLDTIINNVRYLYEFLILSVLLFVVVLILKKKFNIIKEEKIYQLLIVAIMPFIWFICVKNHSYVHSWYTFRILLLTILSLSMVSTYILTEKKKSDTINVDNKKK